MFWLADLWLFQILINKDVNVQSAAVTSPVQVILTEQHLVNNDVDHFLIFRKPLTKT